MNKPLNIFIAFNFFMPRIIHLYLYLIIGTSFALSQNNDSLYKIYKNPARSDSERIYAIHQFVYDIQYNYPDSALKLSNSYFQFSKTKKNKLWNGHGVTHQRIILIHFPENFTFFHFLSAEAPDAFILSISIVYSTSYNASSSKHNLSPSIFA